MRIILMPKRTLCVMVLLLFAGGYLWVFPIAASRTHCFMITRGQSSVHWLKALYHKNVLSPISMLALGTRLLLSGDYRQIQAGEYCVNQGERLSSLIKKLVKGEVVQYPIVLLPGWTMEQWVDYLNKETVFKGEFDKPQWRQWRKHLSGLEGLFAPETYHVTRGSEVWALFRRAHFHQWHHLKWAFSVRDARVPFKNLYQALILASMIEKESACPNEYPKIAGVLMRRLQLRMKLQCDPTVIYALGPDFKPPLRREFLKLDSPYNTYRYYGLPPTPIAMPSQAAIDAAMHPDDSENLYFVIDGQGCHHFSETLEQHREYIRRLSELSHAA